MFKKKVSPQEQVREWKRQLRSEDRALDREIRGIEREEAKVKLAAKQAAKRGDMDSARVLAKELVASHKQKERLYMTKVKLSGAMQSMDHAAATAKIAGALKVSTEVMKSMNRLTNVASLSKTMQEMSQEMMKAGLIEEMTDEILEDGLEEDELESDQEAAVEDVMAEILGKKEPKVRSGSTSSKGKDKVPAMPSVPAAAVDEEDEEEVNEMRGRLEALKG